MLRTRLAQDHPRAGHRGRLQHPVRARPAQGDRRVGAARRRPPALLRHRGEPPRLPHLRARLQGHRLPDRPRRRQDRRRQDAGRDPQPGHRQDHRRLRARPRLLRRQDPALAVRQVPARRAHHRHPDEGHRRGHGHRPHLRGGAAARPSARWSSAAARSSGKTPPGATSTRATTSAIPTDERLWAVLAPCAAARRVEELSQLSGIDPWFLRKLQQHGAHGAAPALRAADPGPHARGQAPGLLRRRHRHARPTACPSRCASCRQEWGVTPVYKMVDTCAAEFEAETPYFYRTYEEENEAPAAARREGARHRQRADPHRPGDRVRLLCRPRRLGPAGGRRRRDHGQLQPRDRLHRLRHQRPPLLRAAGRGGGARPAGERIAERTEAARPPSSSSAGRRRSTSPGRSPAPTTPILGSSAEAIDLAEDRRRFEDLLQSLGIPQPPGAGVTTVEDALATAQRIGYPVLVRPSYVLGGRAMEIVQNATDLIRYVAEAAADRRPASPSSSTSTSRASRPRSTPSATATRS